MRRIDRFLLPLLFALTGCSTVAPFEAAQPTEDQYAVCYSRLGTTAEDVQQIIAKECTGGARPRLIQQQTNLSACPILTPVRAVFTCQPP